MSSPHWRDPLHYVFLLGYGVVNGATLCMRHLGPLFVALGMGLIFAVGAIFVYAIVPMIADSHIELAMHMVIVLTLLFNIYFNYAMCVATDPVDIEDDDDDDVTVSEMVMNEEDEDEVADEEDDGDDAVSRGQVKEKEGSDEDNKATDDDLESVPLTSINRRGSSANLSKLGQRDDESPYSGDKVMTVRSPMRRSDPNFRASYCRTCRMNRPLRAHHCSVCAKCIDQMDHHCPWVNNCVGRGNYRYFVSFLIWLSVGSWYAAVISFVPAYSTLTQVQYKKLIALFSTPLLNWVQVQPANLFQFAFCIAVSAGLAVSILGGWHLYLIATAQTSVEFQINRAPRRRQLYGGRIVSPYSRGNAHANWELVFGRCSNKLLALLPSTRLPPNRSKLFARSGLAAFPTMDSNAIV
ncbi:TPA: hypothetical protein N0F65_003392 [Lagenidium giganteum]|uniref:Palmitoyltransferase n=1 Tax=Lagenidium giganteum TaxID=4803 RepID=A0AAV2YVW2_9STRA|nr:TPA: hypothetical protein N0F65_003392 [Lagenidium giganteum]